MSGRNLKSQTIITLFSLFLIAIMVSADQSSGMFAYVDQSVGSDSNIDSSPNIPLKIAKGKKIAFWKKRLIRNSLRVSDCEINENVYVRTAEIPIKITHQIGKVHQSGKREGEKSVIIRIKTRLGRAISRASGDKNPRVVSGRTFLRIIQNPIMPIPSNTATDSKVVMKRSI